MTRQERREVRRTNLLRKLSMRTGRMTRHHMTPLCRGGRTNERNILILEEARHRAWHLLFGTKTFQEAINLLERVKDRKGYSDEDANPAWKEARVLL